MSGLINRSWLATILMAIYILGLVLLTSFAVGVGAEAGLLIWGAPLLVWIPILGLHFLQPNPRRAGWCLFTLWLGSTYATTGTSSEILVFALITALGVAGYYRSTWLFALAWFGHLLWDFAPRELPQLLQDLPIACMIFDGMIGIYLCWMTWSGNLRAPLAQGYQPSPKVEPR